MILSSSERAWNADPPASGGERWLCLGDDLFAIRAESFQHPVHTLGLGTLADAGQARTALDRENRKRKMAVSAWFSELTLFDVESYMQFYCSYPGMPVQ